MKRGSTEQHPLHSVKTQSASIDPGILFSRLPPAPEGLVVPLRGKSPLPITSAVLLLANAACDLINILKLDGNRTDVVFGNGKLDAAPDRSESNVRVATGGGGWRRCVMRGCIRKSTI